MGKTATLNIRVNPDVKENAESVLAHGTASASAGVIMNADTSAVLTNTDVYTKSACFTVHDMISCFSMMSRRAIPLFIRRIKPFKYILYRT